MLKAIINTVFFGTKFRGGQNFVLTVVGFFNEREYSAADWWVPLIAKVYPSEVNVTQRMSMHRRQILC